jgi:putative endonuclease
VKNYPVNKPWHLYILRCADDTFYTGITTNVKRRFAEHCESPKGAKYTHSHRPVQIAFRKRIGTMGDALRMERLVKHLSKEQKEKLVMKQRELPEKRAAKVDKKPREKKRPRPRAD